MEIFNPKIDVFIFVIICLFWHKSFYIMTWVVLHFHMSLHTFLTWIVLHCDNVTWVVLHCWHQFTGVGSTFSHQLFYILTWVLSVEFCRIVLEYYIIMYAKHVKDIFSVKILLMHWIICIPIILIIAIYLPPGKVYFLNPRSTMIFLAEELRDEAFATSAKKSYLAE